MVQPTKFCIRCGEKIPRDSNFCHECGTKQVLIPIVPPKRNGEELKGTIEADAGVEGRTGARRRPTGLTIIVILWFLGGMLNLYSSSNIISACLNVLPRLSDPRLPRWFTFGVPAELLISLLAFALGLVQVYTIYGLWNGRSWSYRLALTIPILNMIVLISLAGLYTSAPPGFGIRESVPWISVGFSIFWTTIYWIYLRRPHVKEYLGVRKPPTLPVPLAVAPTPKHPPIEAMYCIGCGAAILPEALLCPKCGEEQVMSQEEKILERIEMATDRTWGGYYIIHFTSKRMLVERVLGPWMQALVLGFLISYYYAKRKCAKMRKEQRNPEQILVADAKNYAINYDDMQKVILKKNIMARGRSELTIESKNKRAKLVFGREQFDCVSSLLSRFVSGKIETR